MTDRSEILSSPLTAVLFLPVHSSDGLVDYGSGQIIPPKPLGFLDTVESAGGRARNRVSAPHKYSWPVGVMTQNRNSG